MSLKMRMVCLANSRKSGRHCIAGIRLDDTQNPPQWVRPVSGEPPEGLSEYEISYEHGGMPQVLDIVEIHVLRHIPKDHQVENWLLDKSRRWRFVGRLHWRELERFVTNPSTLWINGYSSHSGRNNRVPSEQAKQLKNSLQLVKVNNLSLERVEWSGASARKPQLRACFIYNGVEYDLPLTDWTYEDLYLHKRQSIPVIGECFLTLSLTHDLEGYCYKLVAAIIDPNMYR